MYLNFIVFLLGYLGYILVYVLTGAITGILDINYDSQKHPLSGFNLLEYIVPVIACVVAGYIVCRLSKKQRHMRAAVMGIVILSVDLVFYYLLEYVLYFQRLKYFLEKSETPEPAGIEIFILISTIPACLLGAWLCSKSEKDNSQREKTLNTLN